MKKITQGSVLSLLALLSTGLVSAHVSVNPSVTQPGYSIATVRVPNEKEVATTQVRIVVPEGVDVGGVMPLAGWTHTEKKETIKPMAGAETHDGGDGDIAPSERVTEVIWSGGKINAGEFMEFPLSVNYSAEAGKVIWKAYQTYAGGEVVAWDGSAAKSPAPVVSLVKDTNVVIPVVAEKTQQTQWLSVVAFVLSVAALALQMKKK